MPNSSLALPTSSSYSLLPSLFNSGVSRSCASRKRKPITLNCVNARSLQHRRLRSSAELRIMRVRSSNNEGSSSNVTIREHTEGEEEDISPTPPEKEANSRPRRIALFVEPSPFSWVIKFLFLDCAHL